MTISPRFAPNCCAILDLKRTLTCRLRIRKPDFHLEVANPGAKHDFKVAEIEPAGFILEALSDALRNADDNHTRAAFNPAVRGKVDQVILLFAGQRSSVFNYILATVLAAMTLSATAGADSRDLEARLPLAVKVTEVSEARLRLSFHPVVYQRGAHDHCRVIVLQHGCEFPRVTGGCRSGNILGSSPGVLSESLVGVIDTWPLETQEITKW
jgi:hypothetical protein